MSYIQCKPSFTQHGKGAETTLDERTPVKPYAPHLGHKIHASISNRGGASAGFNNAGNRPNYAPKALFEDSSFSDVLCKWSKKLDLKDEDDASTVYINVSVTQPVSVRVLNSVPLSMLNHGHCQY